MASKPSLSATFAVSIATLERYAAALGGQVDITVAIGDQVFTLDGDLLESK